jgi:uncharacterized protein (TIGR03435 family)
MQSLDDLALLREYAANNSEAAFAELVTRRVGFVYSSALRQVRDPHLAEEITQAVFIILAQKAGNISDKTILAGWLFKTTRYAAIAQTREAARRSLRTATIEQEMQMLTEMQSAVPDPLWEQMSPLLDEALASLGETDRQSVLLRFFENKSLAEVGNELGTGEDTARKRVTRALGKLHRFFNKRGVSSTTVILAGVLTANSVHAAPAALAQSVTAVALAKGAAASGSTLTLIKGALKIMAWVKMKTAVAVSVGVLLAAGTVTVTVKEIQEHKTYSWQMLENFSPPWSFEKMPQQVEILPTVVKSPKYMGSSAIEPEDDGRFIGINQPIQTIIEYAFHVQYPARVLYPAGLPTNSFDFIATLHPGGSGNAMQNKLKQKFGLVGKFEAIETNTLLLKATTLANTKLKKGKKEIGRTEIGSGYISAANSGLDELAYNLENIFKIPVLNQTGFKNYFDYEVSWNASQGGHTNLNELKQALLSQLGLELVPSREPIEMLVVEKVK